MLINKKIERDDDSKEESSRSRISDPTDGAAPHDRHPKPFTPRPDSGNRAPRRSVDPARLAMPADYQSERRYFSEAGCSARWTSGGGNIFASQGPRKVRARVHGPPIEAMNFFARPVFVGDVVSGCMPIWSGSAKTSVHRPYRGLGAAPAIEMYSILVNRMAIFTYVLDRRFRGIRKLFHGGMERRFSA